MVRMGGCHWYHKIVWICPNLKFFHQPTYGEDVDDLVIIFRNRRRRAGFDPMASSNPSIRPSVPSFVLVNAVTRFVADLWRILLSSRDMRADPVGPSTHSMNFSSFSHCSKDSFLERTLDVMRLIIVSFDSFLGLVRNQSLIIDEASSRVMDSSADWTCLHNACSASLLLKRNAKNLLESSQGTIPLMTFLASIRTGVSCIAANYCAMLV